MVPLFLINLQRRRLIGEIETIKMADELIKPTLTFSSEGLPVPPPKKNLVKIAITIVIAAVLGAGVSLATQTWDPLWNPFRPSPKTVIEKMTKKMAAVQTIRSNIDFETSVKNGQEFNIKINAQADTDNANPDNLKGASEFNLIFNIAGIEISLSFEQKTIGQSFYVKLTTIPEQALGPVLQGLGIDINQIKNTWIKVDEGSLKSILGQEFIQKIEEEQKKSEKKQEMTAEKIKKLIENKELYLVKEELPDETIGKIKTYHYIVAINEQEIKSILPELLNIFGEREGEQFLGGEELEKLQGEIDNFFEKVGEITGEIWIGKRDKLLYKFYGEKNLGISQFTEGEKGTVNVKLNIDFSNFNQPLTIEPPQEFKTFEEIFGPILGPLITEPIMAAGQREIEADMNQIRSAAEIINGDNNSYSGVSCQEKNKGIKLLCDDIAGYTGKKPTIYSSPKHYCAYTELLLKDESGMKIYFCIDDSLKAVETTIFLGGREGYCDGKTFTCTPATK